MLNSLGINKRDGRSQPVKLKDIFDHAEIEYGDVDFFVQKMLI